MNQAVIDYMEQEEGWVNVCESPFEFQHNEGSFASGMAATILYDHYEREYNRKLKQRRKKRAQ